MAIWELDRNWDEYFKGLNKKQTNNLLKICEESEPTLLENIETISKTKTYVKTCSSVWLDQLELLP